MMNEHRPPFSPFRMFTYRVGYFARLTVEWGAVWTMFFVLLAAIFVLRFITWALRLPPHHLEGRSLEEFLRFMEAFTE